MLNPELAALLAEDAAQLARLHDRELDGATLALLQAADFPRGLALLPDTGALQLLAAGLAEAPGLDDLAADYAALYLNGSHGTAPLESVWVGDEHLAAGPPLHEWRTILAEAGLAVAERRQRYDDHLACQLAWLARALVLPELPPQRLVGVLDEHLLFWLPDWAARVQARADTAFYAGLAGLTLAWLETLRDLLAEALALPRPDREQMAEALRVRRAVRDAEVAPVKFMPGVGGPGW